MRVLDQGNYRWFIGRAEPLRSSAGLAASIARSEPTFSGKGSDRVSPIHKPSPGAAIAAVLRQESRANVLKRSVRRELWETIRVVYRAHVVVRRCATVRGVTAEAVAPNLAVT